MDNLLHPKQATQAETARWVELVLFLAILTTATSISFGWQEIPFFTLWGAGWTVIAWALLPEA